MDQRKIVWAPSAINELKQVLDFYIERNGSKAYSIKLMNELRDYINTLSSNPYLGRPSSDFKTRVLVFKAHLIFYQNRAGRIEIVSFWDNRQNQQKRKY